MQLAWLRDDAMGVKDQAFRLTNDPAQSPTDACDQQRMESKLEHSRLLHLCHDAVKEAARVLMDLHRWSLAAPVVLIDNPPNHQAHAVPVGSLPELLPFPSALGRPELRRWLDLQEGMDSREAWRICADGPDGEAFLTEWDRARKEGEAGRLLSIDQLGALIAESRHGFQHSPRELLLVVLEETEGKQPQLISLRLNCQLE